jgi:hypothetical protein
MISRGRRMRAMLRKADLSDGVEDVFNGVNYVEAARVTRPAFAAT